jgi:hypothetical protein
LFAYETECSEADSDNHCPGSYETDSRRVKRY